METQAAVWLRDPCELCSHLPVGMSVNWLAGEIVANQTNPLCKVEVLYPKTKNLEVKRSLNPLNPNAHGLIGAEILPLSIPCGVLERIICSSNSSNC